MELLEETLSRISISKIQMIQNVVMEDINAIVKAIKEYPECVDTSLIDFPCIIYEGFGIDEIEMAIKFTTEHGYEIIGRMVTIYEIDKANTYLDYYVERCKEHHMFLSMLTID